MIDRVIISRHPAAIEFIAHWIHSDWHPPVREGDLLVWHPFGLEPGDPEFGSVYDSVRVISEASPQDVRGNVVYGNVPLHLAAEAVEVWAVEFQPVSCPECRDKDLPPRWVAVSGQCEEEDVWDCCTYCKGTGYVPGSGRPPRGAEYTLTDMVNAGATLVQYTVYAGPGPLPLGKATQGEIERELWRRGLGEILRPSAERA